MFPEGSAFSIGELAVLPRSPPPPPLPRLLPPENINCPDPDRLCAISRGGLHSPTSSPEWLLPPAIPAFDGAGDLADPEDEDEDVATLARARSGDTGEPRSAKTFALASGLSLTSSSCSTSAAVRWRIRSASDIAGSPHAASAMPVPAPFNSQYSAASSSPRQASRHKTTHTKTACSCERVLLAPPAATTTQQEP
uniref:Uncharacterized protein n=1 Tax=Zea mays TaxID=4577 RepID=C4J3Y1_MAIZE|nr:unknown [Zea mays]